MIYLIFGEDRLRAVQKFRQLITAFKKKNPTGDLFRLDPTNFSAAGFEELIVGRGLFGQKFLIACSDLLSLVPLPPVAASPHLFLFLEEQVPADLLEQVMESGGRLAEFKATTARRPLTTFNIFHLADAWGERQWRRLWFLYQEALAAGFSPEEIFWKFVWQTKTMLLVKKTKGLVAGLNPYVAAKARRLAANFAVDELEQLSSRLVELWHTARLGRTDLEVGLERLVLADS